MKIQKIKVEGFRGFNKKQEINLDADVVLVYGINGSGKSSLTEALEWLFFDDISRRRLSPCPGEYRSGIYLKNLYYNESSPPFVEATIENDKKQTITVKKELISESEYKKYINGKEVENFSFLPIDITGHNRPMLAQVEISALVNTEQKDRWEQLSRILGQEELTALRTDLINLRSVKKDAEYKKDEEYFRGLYREAETYNLPETLRESFKGLNTSEIEDGIKACAATKLSKKLTGRLEENIKSIIAQILGSELGKRIADLSPIDTRLIQDKIAELKNRFQKILDLSAKVANAKLKKEEIDFFEAGVKIAKPPTC
ncbi:MAG: AAA family ATPase, partial [Elusimicrobiota bacterium]